MELPKVRQIAERVTVVAAATGAGKVANWISGDFSIASTLGGMAIATAGILSLYLVRERYKIRAKAVTIDWGKLPVLHAGEIFEAGDTELSAICTICDLGLIDQELQREEAEQKAVVKMPDCTHKFHRNCVMKWLKVQGEKFDRDSGFLARLTQTYKPSCPNCRQVITSMLTEAN